jgi:hypothetical protein
MRKNKIKKSNDRYSGLDNSSRFMNLVDYLDESLDVNNSSNVSTARMKSTLQM